MASARRTVARKNAAAKKKSLLKALAALEKARISRAVDTEPKKQSIEIETIETNVKETFAEKLEAKQKEFEERLFLEQQKRNLEQIVEKKPTPVVPEIDKFGTKNIFTNDPGVITNLLKKHICTVEFDRVTRPYGKRIIRCTINPQFTPSLTGLGNFSGLIKVWEVEENRWKSFYASTVNRISYDAEPVGVRNKEPKVSESAREAVRKLDELRTRLRQK